MLVKLYRLNWVESRFSFLSLHFLPVLLFPISLIASPLPSYCRPAHFLNPSCAVCSQVGAGGFFHCLHLNILSYLVQNCVIYFSSCVSCLQFLVGFNARSYKTGIKNKKQKTWNIDRLVVGRQEEHPTCKNWVMRCWCGYMSGIRCRLFACGPGDATAVPKPRYLLPHFNLDWFYLSGTGLPGLFWKRA